MADTQSGYIYNVGSCNLVNGSLWNTAPAGLHKAFCARNQFLDPKTGMYQICIKHAFRDDKNVPTYSIMEKSAEFCKCTRAPKVWTIPSML